MEEIEIPTEHLHETINEKAEEKSEGQHGKWILFVALSTAVMAVLAAIAGLLSGHQANEAMIDQIRASDQWSFYQAKGIKAELAANTMKIMAAMPNHTTDMDDNAASVSRYESEKEAIKTKAEEFEKSSEAHLSKHIPLSKAVTIFQIAIALSAIAVVAKQKLLWYVAMLFMLGGCYFLVMGGF